MQNINFETSSQIQAACIYLSTIDQNNNSILKMSEINVNFLFKTHDNQWLGCEVPKNQIDNFQVVYNPERKLKKLEDILRVLHKNKILNSSLQTKNNLNEIQQVFSIEFLADKNLNPNYYFILNGLSLLETGKSYFKNFFNDGIENLFNELKIKFSEIKQENVEKDELIEEDLINVNLNLDKKETCSSCNINTYTCNKDNFDLNSMLSVPNSNIISQLGSNFSEEVCYSIPTSHLIHFQSSNDFIDSNQVIKSVNLLSPISSEEPLSDKKIISCKKKRKSGKLIEPSFYSVSSFYKSKNKESSPKIFSKQEKIIDSLFNHNNSHILNKKFYRICLNCKTEFRFTSHDLCCDNFICMNCLTTYYTQLHELLGAVTNPYLASDCFACMNNLFYCTFCLVIDLRENLMRCDNILCLGMFHLNCLKTVKLLAKLKIEKTLNEKISYNKIVEEFYLNFSSLFLNEYNTKENENLDEIYPDQIKKINFYLLEKNKSAGEENIIQSLYKVNSRKFYKVFTRIFTKEAVNYFTSVNENNPFQIETRNLEGSGNYCLNHICFNCTTHFEEKKTDSIKICCNMLHTNCVNDKNQHVKFSYKQSNSCHFPLVHLEFYKNIYDQSKAAVKYLIIEIDKKIFYKNKEIQGEKKPLIELLKIHKMQNQISNKEIFEFNKKPSHQYELLSLEELSRLTSIYKNIQFNLTKLTNLKSIFPISNSKAFQKCSCMHDFIKLLEMEENNREISYINNFSNYFTSTKFKKFLKTKESCGEIHKYLCGRDSNCENRIDQIECTNKNCYVKENLCGNRYELKRDKDQVNFKIVKTINKPNYGLIAAKNFEKGEYLMEMLGEIIDEEKLKRKLEKNKIHGNDLYWYSRCYDDNRKVFIYYKKYGNSARFINHSCNPNAILQIWTGDTVVKNVPSVRRLNVKINKKFLIFSTKMISENEEISIDYTADIANYNIFYATKNQFICKCNENCNRIIENDYNGLILNYRLTKNFNNDIISEIKIIHRNILNSEFTEYDSLIYQKGKPILIKNIQKGVAMILSKIFGIYKDINLIYKSKIYSYYKYFICLECNNKVNLIFCINCWRPFHIECIKYDTNKNEPICNKCKSRVNNVNQKKTKKYDTSYLERLKMLSQKHRKKDISLIHSEEKSFGLRKFHLNIFEKNIRINNNINNKTCDQQQFCSMIYEYHENKNQIFNKTKKISSSHNEIHNSTILSKKLLIKSMQLNSSDYATIRQFINDSISLFHSFISIIQSIK